MTMYSNPPWRPMSTALGPHRIGRDASRRDLHGLDAALIVESQLVDAHDAMVPIRLAQRPAVVDDVPSSARRLKHRVMSGAGRDSRVLLEDLPDSLKRPERRRPDRIGDGVVRPGPSALGPHEVVFVVLDQHERALDVAVGRDLLERAAVA